MEIMLYKPNYGIKREENRVNPSFVPANAYTVIIPDNATDFYVNCWESPYAYEEEVYYVVDGKIHRKS